MSKELDPFAKDNKLAESNKELEDKLYKQHYCFVKIGCVIRKMELLGIYQIPYGSFEVGVWTEKKFSPRLLLHWKEYKTKWALTKGELLWKKYMLLKPKMATYIITI